MGAQAWAEAEFASSDLGDGRLNRRVGLIANRMYCNPMRSIHGAAESWSESKAAYRFFSNPKVSSEKILAPHLAKTRERMDEHSVVLLIQDTCFFNFTSHFELEGTGPIGVRAGHQNQSRGFLAHTVLAVAPIEEGLPLGIVSQKIWARPDREDCGQERRSKLRKTPPRKKESFKWIQGLMDSPSPEAGQTLVHVADREADIDSFLTEASEQQAHYLVRSNFNRLVSSDKKLSNWIKDLPCAGEIDIQLKAVSKTKDRGKKEARTARVEIRYSKVTLTPKSAKPLQCYVVSVKEVSKPPQGESPLEWTLLTNLPVLTLESAIEKVTWYRMRWHIENFHKVLKSGCRVENCEVETAHRMKNFMALMSVVAWRLYWISRVSRVDPDVDASGYFSREELALLDRPKKSGPKRKPGGQSRITLIQAVHLLAQLGGFKSRASDGNPGMISIWRGWQVLQNSLSLFSHLLPENETYG